MRRTRQGKPPFAVPSFLMDELRRSFLGVKRPGHNADRLPTFDLNIKVKYTYTCSPCICLHCVDRDKFVKIQTFTVV